MSDQNPNDNYEEEENQLFESLKSSQTVTMDGGNNNAPTTILLQDDNDDDEEEDEQIFIPIKSEKSNGTAAENILLLPMEEDEEYDEPIAEKQISEILLAKDEPNQPVEATPKVTSQSVPSFEEDLPEEMGDGTLANIVSPEFLEAQNAIQLDVYDIPSWFILLEEIQNNRGGNMKLNTAYEQLLIHFPRAAKFWKNLAMYYAEQEKNYEKQKTILLQGAKACYNINLWVDYLHCLLTSFIPEHEHDKSETATAGKKLKDNEYKIMEEELEQAVDSCGLGIDSYPLWSFYLTLVKEYYPDNSILDKNKRLTALRKLYQRCLGIAMENHDILWQEYEQFEKQLLEINPNTAAMAVSSGQTPQAQLQYELQEWYKRYLHTKSIYKERKKYQQMIVMDRLAILPTNTASELQQLQYWNHWLSFELNAPDYVHPEQYIPYIRMLFNQCLNAFYYHSEIWLAYSHFEYSPMPMIVSSYLNTITQQQQQQQGGRDEDQADNNTNSATGGDNSTPIDRAKHILSLAITINPSVIYLRVALAELQELSHDISASQAQYQQLFDTFPHGITFTWYQRFVYRHVGILAARILFKNTFWLRQSLEKPEIALQIYIQHAWMELTINHEPQIALKILDLAHEQLTTLCYQSLSFISLKGMILTSIGDISQLRHFLILAMQEHGITITSGLITNTTTNTTSTMNANANANANSSNTVATAGGFASSIVNVAEERIMQPSIGFGIHITNTPKPPLTRTTNTTIATNTTANTVTSSPEAILRKQYALLSYYYEIEKLSNTMPLLHLYELYNIKHKLESQLTSLPTTNSTNMSSNSGGNKKGGIYEIVLELMERVQPSDNMMGMNVLRTSGIGNVIGGGMKDDLWSMDTLSSLSEHDAELKERCLYYYQTLSGANNTNNTSIGQQQAAATPNLKDLRTMSVDFHLSMSGLPLVVRDFLVKLPAATTTSSTSAVDIEGFLRHMKTVILPPRPLPEESVMVENNNTAGDLKGAGGGSNSNNMEEDQLFDEEDGDNSGTTLLVGNKRNASQYNGSGGSGHHAVEEEDIFRKRSRLSSLEGTTY